MLHKKKIYILLTDTGTLFTRMIKWYTGEPLNHASIAFDEELREIYSFGRKDPGNPFIGGFVKEDIRGLLFSRASCALYCCTVSAERFEQIRGAVRRMEENQHQYKYNLLGLFGVPLNLAIERHNAYFCSEFVASVFADNGMSLVGKPPAVTTPGDLRQSRHLRLVFQGRLPDYRHGRLRRHPPESMSVTA